MQGADAGQGRDDLEHRGTAGGGRQAAPVAGDDHLPAAGERRRCLGEPHLAGVVHDDDVDDPAGRRGRQQPGRGVRAEHPDRTQGGEQVRRVPDEVVRPAGAVPAMHLREQPARLFRVLGGDLPGALLHGQPHAAARVRHVAGVLLAEPVDETGERVGLVPGQPRRPSG